jgi:putative Mn2+ efflux pump MntP
VERRWRAQEARRGRTADQIAFEPAQLRGLALSGGGIRSASFCMGVLQQLHISGVIERLHYLSTVSGGGYSGGAMTWFLSRPADGKGRRFGTSRNNFPFCGGEPAGIRNASTAQAAPETAAPPEAPAEPPAPVPAAVAGIAQPPDPPLEGRMVLDYIRQRSAYLNPGAGFTVVSAAAIVLRSLLTALLGFVLLGAVVLLIPVGLGWFNREIPPFDLNVPGTIAVLLLLLLGLTVVYYSFHTGVPQAERASYSGRRTYQWFAGRLLALALGLLVLSLLETLIYYIPRMRLQLPLDAKASFGTVATALGALGGLVIRNAEGAKPGLLKRAVMGLLPAISLVLLIAGLGILAHRLAESALGHWAATTALILFTAAYCLYTNINLTGLHRFYRDRLMETFMPDPDDIPADGQAAETTADEMPLARICEPDTDGPYHLINANVVLLGGKKARLRSRLGDSFILSRLFCGSEATGYVSTEHWTGEGLLPGLRPLGAMRLPTAMAISGAALNPRAGGDGQGATKGGIVSALLTLLNLRLGFWAPSPAKLCAKGPRPSYRAPPNFAFPGVVQGFFGVAHNEEAHWLELTDGGHFDNTGIYELVRRRVRTIVFADGSTDPDIALQSFANVLEKIYIDFNVIVSFPEDQKELHFTNLMRGTDEPRDLIAEKLQFAKAGFAIGRIKYPADEEDAEAGYLIYIKSTMVRNLPAALYSYKASNPLFPSESLADQFFSEQQFEAYRALGFSLAKAMTKAAKGAPWGAALGIPHPPSGG